MRDKAKRHLTKSQYFFLMGQEFFNDEACIESLIRNVHKLQSCVAALMEGNQEAQLIAKLMYFSNQIIYLDEEDDKEMRITSKFLQFLKFTIADEISYSPNAKEFRVHMRTDLNYDYQ